MSNDHLNMHIEQSRTINLIGELECSLVKQQGTTKAYWQLIYQTALTINLKQEREREREREREKSI